MKRKWFGDGKDKKDVTIVNKNPYQQHEWDGDQPHTERDDQGNSSLNPIV